MTLANSYVNIDENIKNHAYIIHLYKYVCEKLEITHIYFIDNTGHINT